MSDRESSSDAWPVLTLERRARPRHVGSPTPAVEPPSPANVVSELAGRAFAALRRRWGVALLAFAVVLAPVAAYALLSVPTWAARGAVQVSARNSSINPLLELAGADGPSEIETEVEIIKRREMVLEVLQDLRLDIVDPLEPTSVTTDLDVALRGASPVRSEVRRVRTAIASVELDPYRIEALPVRFVGQDEQSFEVVVGGKNDARSYTLGIADTLEDEAVTMAFTAAPVDPGQSLDVVVVPDGQLLEDAMARLRVSAVGNTRKTTNLVELTFTHPDREIARAVVQGLMQRYLDQSLQWQKLSASSASEFISQQLALARGRLEQEEEELRRFAEAEQAVQLDTQAQVTIESTAALEAERLQIELQERAIGGVLAGMKRGGRSANAGLTGSFFQDPVLAASVGALSENETKLAVLRATLTDDHPQVSTLTAQVELQRGEVAKQMRSAQKTLSARRAQLATEVESAMGALSSYPEKELQLARRMRDVEVDQRLYAFLLEKHQESEILGASTTTDKRIVEAAALPHQKASPRRGKLLFTGALGGLLAAIGAVYLAHALQRRVDTVKDLKAIAHYAVYGTVPGVDGQAKNERLKPENVWSDAHGGPAEAFRALAASVSLAPAVPGRGRIVQVTSSQPGEGKSTVIANLAVALSKAGARVLLIDLDLRRPVQHRGFGLRRGPGYADLVSKGGGPAQVQGLLQQPKIGDLQLLTAGSKLPDTLGAVMTPALPGLLAHCSEHYDWVLVDSPPVFVADTSMVARHVDLLLLVGRPGIAERATTRQAVDLLGRVDVPKGLVLNGVSRRHDEYGYAGAYYSYRQRYEEAPAMKKAS